MSSSMLSLLNFLAATSIKASAGQSVNQSIVQQLTKPGNILTRSRNASPIGDMHNTMCRFCSMRSMKNANKSSCVTACTPLDFATFLISSQMALCSSLLYRPGISPEVRALFMSSKNDSLTIWVSSRIKTVCTPTTPACRYNDFRSSRNSLIL